MKRNILFVLPFLPYPMVSGGHQALFNGIACIKDDYNIFIAYYCDGRNYHDEEEFLKCVPNATLLPMDTSYRPISFKARFWNKVKRIASSKEASCYPQDKNGKYDLWLWARKPQPAKWGQLVYDACQKYNIDIAQVEMPWIMSFILTLPDNVKKVFVHHELGFVKQALELKNAPDNNIYARACYLHTEATERGILNHADHIITLSPIDKRKLEDFGVTSPITSSFAIVNTKSELTPYISDKKILTFVGPDDNGANPVGLRWFLENCWNKLNGEYKLKVIGRWRESNKQTILRDFPEVEFHGFVDSLFDTLKGTIMIVPITIGSGIRMKILEAASMGIPFVSTTVGAEGIPLRDGKDCFLADEPKVFVDDILKLQDKALRMKFIHNANQMVKDNFSFKALRDNRLSIYKKL